MPSPVLLMRQWGRCDKNCGLKDSHTPSRYDGVWNHYCVLENGHTGRCEFISTCGMDRVRTMPGVAKGAPPRSDPTSWVGTRIGSERGAEGGGSEHP